VEATVGFSARFFSVLSFTLSWDYVEFDETPIAKGAFFCRGRGQKLQFDRIFWEKIARGETSHAKKRFFALAAQSLRDHSAPGGNQ
jgi:hypothetical protein